MSKHSNTPELRFPEFKDEWKDNELGKLLSIISGHSPSYYSEGSEYPLYKVNDLNNNSKFQNYSDLYVEKKHTPLNKRVIIFPKRGAAILLNKIRIINTPGYIDTNLMGLEFNDVNDTEFYYYAILREGLYRIADTSTIPQINNKHISPYKIYSPGYTEKNKLGNFFSKLDRQIELEEEKLELLEQQKKGYMQKIFSQKLRFKDENGDEYPEWKSKKLKDVANVYQPQNLSQNNFQKKGYPVYGANGVIGYYKDFNHSNMEIAVACRGNTCGRVNLTEPKSWITSNAMVVDIIDEMEIEFYFLYQYLRIINYSNVISGSGQPQITRKNMNSVELLVPNYIEQQKIGNLFRRFDDFIEKQSQKVDLLKERKKGFLQKMFI